MPPRGTPARESEARTRLLRTASEIFYTKGIHSVGVEEIVEKAQVTRATLYRQFHSKEELIVAYLVAASQAERAGIERVLEEDRSPEEALRAVADAVAAQIHNPIFRGCAFLNAAAEYPDKDHPVHQAVLAHRQWYHDLVADLVARLDIEPTERLAELFVLLRDGAMAAGCLSDPDEVTAVFLSGIDSILSPSH